MDNRIREPLKEALAYLNEQPPRVSLARACIKAALDPEQVRWSDGSTLESLMQEREQVSDGLADILDVVTGWSAKMDAEAKLKLIGKTTKRLHKLLAAHPTHEKQ